MQRKNRKNNEQEERYIKKVLEGMVKSTKIKPNKLEKKMIKIMNDNFFPFIFVGDGNFWIRGKTNSFNPDFLHKNKKEKKIIEVFGNYGHNKKNHKKRDKKRIKTYQDKGFSVLVIWEDQIRESKKKVSRSINNFLENGI